MENNQRQSILCPNCRHLISKSESRCPYCGISNPASWWKNNPLIGALHSADQIIKVIIAVNACIFIFSLVLSPQLPSLSMNPFMFLSPDNRSLLLLGATGTIPIDRLHRWWSLVSASYLHGGILHIVFNMIALRQIGPLVVQEYGGARMFTIYTLGGVFGYLVSYYAGITFTIGASAAVCALIGSALYYGKSRGGYYGQEIYRQVGGWVVAIFVFGLLMPGINSWGHGGGIAGGVILGFLLGYQEKVPENLLHKTLAAGCVVITALILAWAVFSGIAYVFYG